MTIIKRKLLKDLTDHRAAKEISLIIGPRQAGKTTLMNLLRERLNEKGENTIFLNLDSEMDNQHFLSQQHLINKIKLELGAEKGYVFIDEIQRKENAGIFLKGIYDLNLGYKFIVSGSGSLELKEKIHESLVGRKRVFELNTISFEEFVNFRTNYRYDDRLDSFFELEKEKTAHLLTEYLSFGGYPKVVLEETSEEKIRIIDEIFQSYIEKDISYLLQLEKIESFKSLINILASQIGQLVNYSELSSTVGVALATVKNYLWYGEKTFVLQRLSPYFTNIRKEITKAPVFYFYDIGLRNYPLGFFGRQPNQNDLGPLFENFVYNILREIYRFKGVSLHYWRTKDRAEVDFVIESGRNLLPIEVKYKEMKKAEIKRSLRNFIARYKPEKAFVINLSLEESLTIGRTKVMIMPFWKLLLEDETLTVFS
ncbi:ATP-binding protein [Candidatus Omnitrophota bacterium]